MRSKGATRTSNNAQITIVEDQVLFIETDYYHSYTFIVDNDDELPLQNLTFSLKDDGTYTSYLVTYDISQDELDAIKNGIALNLDDKTTIEELDIDSGDFINRNQRTTRNRCNVTIIESCTTVDTCSFGGEIHVAGGNCTEIDGTSTSCRPVSVISNCPSGGNPETGAGTFTEGGGGGATSQIDPNDPVDVTVPCSEVLDGQSIGLGNGECIVGGGLTSPIGLEIREQDVFIRQLENQTSSPAVKARIQELQNQVNSSSTEQGSEFKLVNDILVDFPIPARQQFFDRIAFPNASAETRIQMHLHHNITRESPFNDNKIDFVTPIPSMEDTIITIANFQEIAQAQGNSENDALKFSVIIVHRGGLFAIKVNNPEKAAEFIDFYLNNNNINSSTGLNYRQTIRQGYNNINNDFAKICDNMNGSTQTVCSEEVENELYLNLYQNWFSSLDAGISLFSSTEVDDNGNPIWNFIIESKI